MNRLRQMSIFAHIVEAGSISKAAEKLALSKSVVSQHLKSLEGELGLALIKRTTRRQTLTEAGQRFYAHCKELNLIADNAWDSALAYQAEPKGRVCITAPHALMDTFVAPVMADLIQQYCALQPVLIGEDQHIDLMEHNIDLAVRVGSSKDSNFKQQRIGHFRDVLCGSANKINKDINQLNYIANAWQGEQIRHEFKQADKASLVFETQAHCMTNSIHSCLALIKAGAGIGILPDFYFKQIEPQVINLMPNMLLPQNVIYALNPFGDNPPLTVRVCIEALKRRLIKMK